MSFAKRKAMDAWHLLQSYFTCPADMNPADLLEWPPSRETFNRVYRTVARENHPDHGGDADITAEINDAAKAVRGQLDPSAPATAERPSGFRPCDRCDGQGAVVLPSRYPGGRGVRQRCSACGGAGEVLLG